MKHSLFFICVLFIILFSNFYLIAQEPFNIPMIDPPKIKIVDYSKTSFGEEIEQASPAEGENNLSTFSKGALGMTSNFKDFGNSLTPNINLNIIQYRLGIYSYQSQSIGQSDPETTRVYLPLIFLSKISTKYDSTQITSFDDLTSYAGSPITIRLMPSYSFPVGLDNTLTIGHVSDLRAIMYKDKTDNNLKTQFGYYCSFGIKYAGRGEVRDESGQFYQGRWSISVLSSIFFTDSNTKRLFLKNPDDVLGGIEMVFKFIVSETKLTRFNIYASLQKQFSSTNMSSPWTFKITFGN